MRIIYQYTHAHIHAYVHTYIRTYHFTSKILRISCMCMCACMCIYIRNLLYVTYIHIQDTTQNVATQINTLKNYTFKSIVLSPFLST